MDSLCLCQLQALCLWSLLLLSSLFLTCQNNSLSFTPSAPLSQFTDSRGSALKAVFLSLSISFWPLSFLWCHPTHVYYTNVLPSSHLFLQGCTGLLTAFPALLSGDCRHKVWLDPAVVYWLLLKGQTQEQPNCLWKCTLQFCHGFQPISPLLKEKKKKDIIENKGG